MLSSITILEWKAKTTHNTPCAQRYWRKQHKILAFKPGIPPKTHRTIPLIFRSLLVSL